MNEVHPVRALIAAFAVVCAAAMIFLAVDIPDAWWAAVGLIIGFYFGK